MLSQVKIDKNTGKVDGFFLSDGGVSVIKANGEIRHWWCSDQKHSLNRLSTKQGVLGATQSIIDVIGGELKLRSGDIIFVYSDGVSQQLLEELAPDINNKAALLTKLNGRDPYQNRSDDQSIVFYQHR